MCRISSLGSRMVRQRLLWLILPLGSQGSIIFYFDVPHKLSEQHMAQAVSV